MKRRKMISIICLSTLLAFTGCGSNGSSVQQTGDSNPSLTEDENSDEVIQSENEDPQESGKREVKIYYIDDNSGSIIAKNVEIENEDDIWEALQETAILTEECKMLSFSFNEAEGTIDLDFNKALGDRIRSMGTTGETEIIGCLVNTFLDAYDCEKIKLTEEGAAFETGHGAEYNGYVGKIEF